MKNWQWSRKCLFNSGSTHGLVIVSLYDASALGRRGALWLGSNPSEQPQGWHSMRAEERTWLLGATPSPVPFARTPRCPCRVSRSQAALRTAWAASSPRARAGKTEPAALLSEEGWNLALASCSIDLSCFYCFFFKTTVPETSFLQVTTKLPCFSFSFLLFLS